MRSEEPLNSKELAILPHIMRHMAMQTKGRILVRKLYQPIEAELKKTGIGLKRIDSGIRRVLQHLRHQGILEKGIRGVALMTKQGWETAQHYR